MDPKEEAEHKAVMSVQSSLEPICPKEALTKWCEKPGEQLFPLETLFTGEYFVGEKEICTGTEVKRYKICEKYHPFKTYFAELKEITAGKPPFNEWDFAFRTNNYYICLNKVLIFTN